VETLIASGVIMDRAMLYWHARVSDRYPTVEIRVTDVALDARTAVSCAGLARALVAQALSEGSLALPVPRPPPDAVRAAAWQAAHRGLGDGLLDLTPTGGRGPRLRPASDLVLEVAEAACAGLPPTERGATLAGVLEVFHSRGGAERQRAAVRVGGMHGLIELLRSSVAA
jgi:carboxylate-amine ligase